MASRNLLLKQWDWANNVCTRTWKVRLPYAFMIVVKHVEQSCGAVFTIVYNVCFQAIHTAPVSCMSYDCTSTLLATGGSDSTVKVWDTIQKYCTHNLTGHHGVVRYVGCSTMIDYLL